MRALTENIFSRLVIPIMVITTLMICSVSHAQIVDMERENRLIDMRKAFESLTFEKRSLYHEYIKLAKREYSDQKYFSALVYLADAESIFAQNYLVNNTRGTIYAKINMPNEGIKEYEKALSVNPYDIQVNLNLIDLYFQQKDYGMVIKLSNRLNAIFISEENLGEFPAYPYRDFKCLIAFYEMEKREPGVWVEKIREMESKYSYMDDHPYYYFVNALKSLKESNKEEGLLWIMKFYKVFRKPQVVKLWADVLIESGYLDSNDWNMYPKPHGL